MVGKNFNDPTMRFSDRVENYVKFRPGYPSELPAFLEETIGLTPEWDIADIGSGTGISSKLFLDFGNRVYGIEPNEAMRAASIGQLGDYPKFNPSDGDAYNTGLNDNCVDLVFAAQSFHWFCNRDSVNEFRRILKPGGFVGLVWNEREIDIDGFHVEYEGFLKRFGVDYEKIRHDKVTKDVLDSLFGTQFTLQTFCYQQLFDFEGLKGRLLSSSYMPAEGAENFQEMCDELKALFAVHAEMGRISVLYKTKFFYCSI